MTQIGITGAGRDARKATGQPGEFSLKFRSDTDRIADDLYGYMDILWIQGPSGRAVNLINRQGGDLVHPIGLFGMTVSRPQLDKLMATLDAIKWNQLPAPEGGDILDARLSVDYSHGRDIVQRSFSAGSRGAFMGAVTPFIDQIGALDEALEQHPLRVIRVTLEREPKGFKLVIKNVGTGPVMIGDPRLPGLRTGTTRATIAVGHPPERADSYHQPTMHPLALEGRPDEKHPVVTIGAGQAYEVRSVPWAPSGPGHYYVEGTWEDYLGPSVDSKTVMPVLPEPDQLQVDDPRPYPLRGAAFADVIHFFVDSPGR